MLAGDLPKVNITYDLPIDFEWTIVISTIKLKGKDEWSPLKTQKVFVVRVYKYSKT